MSSIRLLEDLIYITGRIIRKNMPSKIFTKMLVSDIVVKSSGGYADIENCHSSIIKNLEACGFSLKGKSVLELGFGGALHMGMLYQMHEAKEIYLIDKFARQKFELCGPFVQSVLDKFPEHDFKVSIDNTKLIYDKDVYKVSFEDLEKAKITESSIDLIVSLSVYEHVEDIRNLLIECVRILSPNGIILTSIDMSDHFQKYPFHMLKFSKKTWEKHLNPPSNLNRLRSLDYERMFADNGLKIIKKIVTNKSLDQAVKSKPFFDKQFKAYPDEVLAELGATYLLKHSPDYLGKKQPNSPLAPPPRTNNIKI